MNIPKEPFEDWYNRWRAYYWKHSGKSRFEPFHETEKEKLSFPQIGKKYEEGMSTANWNPVFGTIWRKRRSVVIVLDAIYSEIVLRATELRSNGPKPLFTPFKN